MAPIHTQTSRNKNHQSNIVWVSVVSSTLLQPMVLVLRGWHFCALMIPAEVKLVGGLEAETEPCALCHVLHDVLE